MIRGTLAILLGLGPIAAFPLQETDKVGKEKAPFVAKRTVSESQKRKNVAISITIHFQARNDGVTADYQGILRKDFAAVRGSAEIYAKGGEILVRSGDRFDLLSDLKGQEAALAAGFKNPALLLGEIARLAPAAIYLSDEPVDQKPCKTLSLKADESLVKQHLREFEGRISGVLKSASGGFDLGRVLSYFDEKGTDSTYRIWVSTEDLLVRKIEWVFKPVLKKDGLPPGVKPIPMESLWTLQFSKWDEDVAFDIPRAVKAKWGIR
jgi:hypothetical protein